MLQTPPMVVSGQGPRPVTSAGITEPRHGALTSDLKTTPTVVVILGTPILCVNTRAAGMTARMSPPKQMTASPKTMQTLGRTVIRLPLTGLLTHEEDQRGGAIPQATTSTGDTARAGRPMTNLWLPPTGDRPATRAELTHPSPQTLHFGLPKTQSEWPMGIYPYLQETRLIADRRATALNVARPPSGTRVPAVQVTAEIRRTQVTATMTTADTTPDRPPKTSIVNNKQCRPMIPKLVTIVVEAISRLMEELPPPPIPTGTQLDTTSLTPILQITK